MPPESSRAVFLSYASQDAEAARRICEALRADGIEVWFDADGGLEHGDEWDAKIRRQIKECVLFIPVISAHTQEREEGYFRLEWDLAAERARTIASGVPFLLPVVIDDTREPDALVPDRFRSVQWTRLPGGVIPPEVRARYLKLWSHRLGAARAGAKAVAGREAASPAAAAEARTEPGAADGAARRSRRPAALILAALVAGVILAGYLALRPSPTGESESRLTRDSTQGAKATPAATADRAATTAQQSVAVLPFVNLSTDRDNEYFSDGVAEELRMTLQNIPGLLVAAHASAWTFKGKEVTAREVGEKLGMAHVVAGEVQKSGNRVAITARLSRAATNEELWSKRFGPLELTDVFATQTELAQSIVAELRGRLSGESAATARAEAAAQVRAAEIGGTRHVEAHELYLRGKFFTSQFTVQGLRRAEELLQEAVRRDERFVLAWTSLAEVGRLQSGYESTRERVDAGFELSRRASARALELAPDSVAARQAVLDFQLLAFDWKGARASLDRVMKQAPNLALATEMRVKSVLGELDRAVEAGRRAVALDPVNAELREGLGFALMAARRFAESEAEFRRVAELSPSAPYAHAGTALALLLQGRADEATAEARREVQDWCRLFALGLTCWAQGQRAESDAALAELIRKEADIAAYQIAEIHAFRREADPAFAWLERALRQRDPGLLSCRTDLLLESLLPDPRWPAFLRRMGLHDEQLR